MSCGCNNGIPNEVYDRMPYMRQTPTHHHCCPPPPPLFMPFQPPPWFGPCFPPPPRQAGPWGIHPVEDVPRSSSLRLWTSPAHSSSVPPLLAASVAPALFLGSDLPLPVYASTGSCMRLYGPYASYAASASWLWMPS